MQAQGCDIINISDGKNWIILINGLVAGKYRCLDYTVRAQNGGKRRKTQNAMPCVAWILIYLYQSVTNLKLDNYIKVK